MSNYICLDCRSTFEEPVAVQSDTYPHDPYGPLIPDTSYLCPFCRSDLYLPAKECPGCNTDIPVEDALCFNCRKALLQKVNQFFDALTPHEIAQFDEWMDGNSIEDRRWWT